MDIKDSIKWLENFQYSHDCYFKIELDGIWHVSLTYSGNDESHDITHAASTLIEVVEVIKSRVDPDFQALR